MQKLVGHSMAVDGVFILGGGMHALIAPVGNFE